MNKKELTEHLKQFEATVNRIEQIIKECKPYEPKGKGASK